jgi:hypothetical protein
MTYASRIDQPNYFNHHLCHPHAVSQPQEPSHNALCALSSVDYLLSCMQPFVIEGTSQRPLLRPNVQCPL